MRTLKAQFNTLTPSQRLYQLDRPIIALTGGIATGKSTVTKILIQRGIKIIDADALVKNIYQRDEAKEFIKNNVPQAWVHQEISFPKLREIFFKDGEVKKAVEIFIYNLLPQAFLEATQLITDQNYYFYDVPLLFEKALDTKVDVSLVVYAPAKVQIARLMNRDGHLEDMAKNILTHQMDIEEKKLNADLVIDNSRSLTELAAEVDQVLLQLFN
jgi:dephospho-CoA kinase